MILAHSTSITIRLKSAVGSRGCAQHNGSIEANNDLASHRSTSGFEWAMALMEESGATVAGQRRILFVALARQGTAFVRINAPNR